LATGTTIGRLAALLIVTIILMILSVLVMSVVILLVVVMSVVIMTVVIMTVVTLMDMWWSLLQTAFGFVKQASGRKKPHAQQREQHGN
jgi:hypothetical protein